MPSMRLNKRAIDTFRYEGKDGSRDVRGHVPGRGVGAVGNRLGVATAKSLA